MAEQRWKVEAKMIQLLPFLKEKLKSEISGKFLKRSLDHNQCFVNGRVERFGTRWLAQGDEVIIKLEQPVKNIAKSMILYEDQDLLICNKSAGIVSESDSLKAQLIEDPSKLILLHRLDKDTSGVLLFAKSSNVQDQMIRLFREKQVFKKYYAIVDGIPDKKEGVIDNFLGKLSSYHGQAIWGSVASDKGLRAVTKWKLISEGASASLLECQPITGRTHQLRVHLSQLGHPILGDFQYGRHFKCSFKPHRQLLHASELTFKHPATDRLFHVKAPLPEDFKYAFEKLFNKGNVSWNF